jgi:transcription elongation GreA/GreB family factor
VLRRMLTTCTRSNCTRQPIFQDASQRILLQPQRLQSLLNNLDEASHQRSRLDACVRVGSKVTLKQCTDDDVQITFYVVTPQQADPVAHRISILSPIGSAVLGCRRGARVKLDWRGRKSCWEIMTINSNS